MVHAFSLPLGGVTRRFLWDIESGSLHAVDEAAYFYALNRYGLPGKEEGADRLASLGAEERAELEEEFCALERAGVLNAKATIKTFRKRTGLIKAMCLHICHDCNLSCDYCFASGGTYDTAKDYMSAETGKRAVDFLLAHAGARKNLEIDFFGGEPLMNLDAVKEIVEYAKAEGEKRGKRFSFTMTTNCLLLDEATREWLDREMENVVLSIDGRACTHDGVRHARNGKKSFEPILHNATEFRKIRGDRRYYVRGTFTAWNLDFASDVFFLNDAGFDQISVEPVVLDEKHPLAIRAEHLDRLMREYERLAEGYYERRKGEKWFNFFHFMIDLEHGPCLNKRLTGCGAGTEYLAVSPTGELYPCHRFVGKEEWKIGTVEEGILHEEIRERFAALAVTEKAHCTDCAAKYYCGGGCAANALEYAGSLNGQYEIGCALTKKRMEISLALAALEKEEREETPV